jgi:hypothetical protein
MARKTAVTIEIFDFHNMISPSYFLIMSGHVYNEKRLSLWPKVDKPLRIWHRHHPLSKTKNRPFSVGFTIDLPLPK